MQINKLLTPYNYNRGNINRVKYIVIHYVGALGGAKANCEYYASRKLNASAHYFVGHSGEVWQSVEDANIAWHCGANKYKHNDCRNNNSIGIEMCCKQSGGKWYFEQATITSAIALTKDLMARYNVPVSNVIRHYDVTGKICPEPYVRDNNAWNAFKNALVSQAIVSSTKEKSGYPTLPFTVNVIINDLNYRSHPSMNGIVRGVTGKGTFTIVEVKDDWGKLKSGAGWIYLGNSSYCTVKGAVSASNTPKHTVDEVARMIIQGKLGNGHETRKAKVEAFGLNYETVRKRVNELLK